MRADYNLKLLGEPRPLFMSKMWAQDVGVILNEFDDAQVEIHATIYGSNAEHVRSRALKFVKVLKAGKIISDERIHNGRKSKN